MKPGIRLSKHQQRLKNLWNKRVQDPLAFVPFTERLKISNEEAKEANQHFGQFAIEFFKQVLKNSIGSAEMRKKSPVESMVMAVGYGKKYDSEWLEEATLAGFQVCWVDVSDISCNWALEDMQTQYRELISKGIDGPVPIVFRGDISHVLANPQFYGLDQETIDIWYLCRTLGCMSQRSATRTLRCMGRSLAAGKNSDNRVVIINSLRDCNPEVVGETTKLFTREMLLSNLSIGAKRPVQVDLESSYKYFSKTVSALSFKAK